MVSWPMVLPNRTTLRRSVALLLTVPLFSSCAPARDVEGGSGEVLAEMRVADTYSTKHPLSVYGPQNFEELMETQGFSVTYFPAGQMGKSRDLAHFVQTGVLDIAPVAPAYVEDEFPLSSVGDLPSEGADACVVANAMMELLEEGGILYENEFKDRGVRPLWVSVIPGYELVTSFEVKSPSDVRGRALRSPGGAFDLVIDAIGASPVSMPAAEVYEAMARHTIDGTPTPYISAVSYNFHEVADHMTKGLNLGAVNIPYAINEDTWQSLTPEQQEHVRLSARETQDSLCKAMNEGQQKSVQVIEENGVTFTEINGADREAWDAVLEDVKEKWAQSLDEKGLPASEVLEAYEKAVQNNAR